MKQACRGEVLISLMLALSLSLGIVLSALHLTAQAGLLHQYARQQSILEDQANQVLELIERLLQQAGYIDVTAPMAALPARPLSGTIDAIDNASVTGVASVSGSSSASSVSSGPATGVSTKKSASLASDVLVIRLRGNTQGGVLNCAGFTVAAPSGPADAAGLSMLYVDLDPANEPELRCYFSGASQWSSHAVASGVLSFQVRLGIDTDDDGLPNFFVSGSQLSSKVRQQATSELSLRTRIVAVHIGLLMRSTQRMATPVNQKPLRLLSEPAPTCSSYQDPEAHVLPSQLKSYRLHQVFEKIIFLNNSLRPDA
jgi:hypothetical protein